MLEMIIAATIRCGALRSMAQVTASDGEPAMTPTPNLERRLQQTLGTEAASDLRAWMQSMDAYRTDIGELRREMQLGFARIDERFARVDGRMDTMQASFDGRMDAMRERFEGILEKGLREQTRFFFLAWSVILAGIIGLYARAG
jgi:hypothetical protein